MRGFVASADICGDLEFYGAESIRSEDPDLLKIFQSFQLDEHHAPVFNDAFFYAQVLFRSQQYAAAAPIFERALTQLNEIKGFDTRKMRRVVIDQAGISYGMAGDLPRARTLFEHAIAVDLGYPMYYYNLASADAAEKNLPAARKRLQQALDRKANVLPGEKMPAPPPTTLSSPTAAIRISGDSSKLFAPSDSANTRPRLKYSLLSAQGRKSSQTRLKFSVPHPFRVFLRKGWEISTLDPPHSSEPEN